MAELSHKACPYVDCGSSDAFSYNTDKMVGKCHSCDEGYPSNNETFDWAETKYPTKSVCGDTFLSNVVDDKNWSYNAARGINRSTMEFYDVKTYFEGNGDIFSQTYPYPSGGIKTRYWPKDGFSSSGDTQELFGMNLWNAGCSKSVTITEGELDALSAHQMLKSNYTNPVVSLPSASPSKKFWEKVKPWLDSFEKIILSIDNDEPGDKVVSKLAEIFPGKVWRMQHSKYKDANEFLTNNDVQAYKSAWWNAQRIKPDTILSTAEDFNTLYDETPDYEYCPTGVDALDKRILGLHKGYFTVIVAPTGIGKTEFMRYLEYQVLTKSEYSIASCHLEEAPLRSVLGLVSYDLEDNLTRKDLVEEKGREDDVRASMAKLTKDERFYQFQLKTDETPEDLVDRIRFMVSALGVDYIFFEPIQDVVSGNISDKESKLSDLSNTLSRLAPELNVGIIAIAHANEDGDTKYCKTIAQKAAFEIILDREQDSDDEEVSNRTYLRIGRKNRVGGGSGPAGHMDFDVESYMLTPDNWKPTPVKVKNDGEIPF